MPCHLRDAWTPSGCQVCVRQEGSTQNCQRTFPRFSGPGLRDLETKQLTGPEERPLSSGRAEEQGLSLAGPLGGARAVLP